MIIPPLTRTDPPVPATKAALRARKRRGWTTFALVTSLIAVGVEAAFHPCASFLFDPLPDTLTAMAYAWVIAVLWLNQAVLVGVSTSEDAPARPNRLVRCLGPKRATGLALALTPVALLVAGMVTWMFAPLFPFAWLFALSALGAPISALVMAPLLDLVLLIIQMRLLLGLWRAHTGQGVDSRVAAGALLAGAGAVFLLIVRPALIGRWTAQALETTGQAQQAAFRGLRVLGGQQAMLDLTYRRNPAYWVCFGYRTRQKEFWPWSGYAWADAWDNNARLNAAKARRTYFLLTGVPFESLPRPASWGRQREEGATDDVAVEEQGGYAVGRSVPGVCLAASQMDFASDPAAETATGDWTLTFQNDTDTPQEARADILLAPGATCHAVSLWINGVEKPAAFGSPQRVRAAYQEVAIVKRRDPLLVTMPAPGHLLAQCFPVPPHAQMKIKLGITSPLLWRETATGPALNLPLPAFGQVNFAVPARLPHRIQFAEWGEGRPPAGWVGSAPLVGEEIFQSRRLPVGMTRPAPHIGDILAPGVVRVADPLAPAAKPVDVWLLLDASAGMAGLLPPTHAHALGRALSALPAGSHIYLADTSAASATPLAAPQVAQAIVARVPEAGGVDPAPALESVLRQAQGASLTARHPSVVVFLHTASPAGVSALDNVRHILKTPGSPALVCVPLTARAPDAVATDLAGFAQVHTRRALPEPNDVGTALAEAVTFATHTADVPLALPLGGHGAGENGVGFSPAAATAETGEALARLQIASATVAGWFRANQIADPDKALDERIAAGRPAAGARLVTPLSSAVVLETRAQYAKNGLDTKNGKKGYDHAKDAPAPTPEVNTPEPATAPLVLMGLVVCAVLWLRRRFGEASP